MRGAKCVVRGACCVVLALAALAGRTELQSAGVQQTPPAKQPDVIFVATDPAVVRAMLTLAKVTKNDVVYDLGCGDGRIPIAAAKTYGARGVGIDIDPARVREATANARHAGVSDKVTFKVGDIFDPSVTFSDATVVTLFLLPELNLRLRPRLLNELTPGARVVSNSFDMGTAWRPDKTAQVGNFAIYLWTVPRRTDAGPVVRSAQ